MNVISRVCPCILVAASLVLSAASLPVQAGLTFKLKPVKSQYLLDEPLKLVFTMVNDSDTPVKALRIASPGTGTARIFITPPGGEEYEYADMWSADPIAEWYPSAGVLLKPHDSYSGVLDLSYGARRDMVSIADPKPTLSSPGAYTIVGMCLVPEDKSWLGSNSVHIEVRQPSGTDKRAFDILTEDPEAKKSGLWNQNGPRIYERVLKECPRSGYALDAKFSLARDPKLTSRVKADMLAEIAGNTPSGVLATRLEGAERASQDLLHRAFCMYAATDSDRIDILLELATVRRMAPKNKPVEIWAPLANYASALQYWCETDPTTREVRLIRGNTTIKFKVGADSITVNGRKTEGCPTKDKEGKPHVSLAVVAVLAAERWGGGIPETLKQILPPDYAH